MTINMENNQNRYTDGDAYLILKKKAELLVMENIKGDRKGLPGEKNYLHSLRVEKSVSDNHHWDDPDYDVFLAALLHDIVEDGGISLDKLKELGFAERTIELVDLCSHSLGAQDKTERWVLMIARLIEANDDDAWRIKLADLADNLGQSRGLSPENRRFMIEVKTPLLLRLAQRFCMIYRNRHLLEVEMEKQRLEMGLTN